MELGGWGGCGQTAPGQPFAGQQRDELMAAADGSFCPEELEGLQAWALRVLLQRPLLQSQLRALALGGREDGSRSKSLLELAVAALADQGLVVRQGYGAFAALSIPDSALPRAEALAFSEFPDEGQLPLYGGSPAAAALTAAGGAHHTCPPARLSRLRRHSSPRQFPRMPGIEKASGGRRSKRGIADEMGQLQLQKRARLQDVFSGGEAGGAPPGAVRAPFMGLAAMSP